LCRSQLLGKDSPTNNHTQTLTDTERHRHRHDGHGPEAVNVRVFVDALASGRRALFHTAVQQVLTGMDSHRRVCAYITRGKETHIRTHAWHTVQDRFRFLFRKSKISPNARGARLFVRRFVSQEGRPDI
jgi:hypothetical protein